MGKINSRAKGAQGERELAGYLREQGWRKARRTQQYAGNPEGGSGDVVCENFPFHIEGKRCQALKPEEWMAQAKRDCPAGKIPAVFFRRNGRKEWLVVLSADDVCELARQLAPAREIKIDYMPSTNVKGFYVTSPHDLDQLTPTTTNNPKNKRRKYTWH
jgi:hypothetical protein